MAHVGACETCGKRSEYEFACRVRRFCSNACSSVATWARRKRAETAQLLCVGCSTPFTLKVHELRRRQKHGCDPKFCSWGCYQSNRAMAAPIGRAPAVGNRISRECAHCGAALLLAPSRARGLKSYCGRECHALALKALNSPWAASAPAEARRAYFRDYAATNRDTHNRRSREWARRNRAYRNYIQQLRRAAGELTFEEWREVIDSSGGRCAHCGSSERLEVDHKTPVVKGGRTERSNLQVLCRTCNASKGDGEAPKTVAMTGLMEIRP